MTDPTAPTMTAQTEAPRHETPFDSLEETIRSSGPEAAIDRLIDHLDRAGEYRAMLNALLLKARHELKMPLVAIGPLAGIPEPAPPLNMRKNTSRQSASSARATSRKATFPPRGPTIGQSPRASRSPMRSPRTNPPKTMSAWEPSSKSHSTTESTPAAASS